MANEAETKKTRRPGLFAQLFGKKKAIDILAEEGMESQWKAAAKRFFRVPLNVVALVLFVVIFVYMMFGVLFIDFEETYQDVTQKNVSPGRNMMDYPAELNGNCKMISAGSKFSIGLSNDGKIYVWGKTKLTNTIDMAKVPEELTSKDTEVTMVAAGYDHAVALTSRGKVIVWGNTRLHQGDVPSSLNGRKKVVQIAAGYQASLAVTEDGRIYFWGNESLVSFKAGDYNGHIKKAAFCFNGIVALLDDGSVASLTRSQTSYSNVPTVTGGVDIAATAQAAAVLLEDGSIVQWGSVEKNLSERLDTTAIDGKVVAIAGGRYHYSALTDTGHVYSWGYNNFGQADAPTEVTDAKEIYAGYFQSYAVGESGKIHGWGLKGYLLGADGYGRDILSRIIGGGRMTLTIGAISVIISTFIGIVLGSISGYFGGKTDIIIMRIQEVISSIPFMPLAMILSVVIGSRVSENGRIVLIMCILGFLNWPSLCRLVRAQVLAEREKEYIVAGRAMGISQMAIIFRHIFPNVISVIMVNATLSFASCLLTESGLSYLGFGVVEPKPTWGNMLNGANDSVIIQNYWWCWVFPAIILGICTICINIIGDGLRDALDPRADRER